MAGPADAVRRMTALDAAFYHLERRGQLLHVGGVYTVEGGLDHEELIAHLAARLHLVPRYTERVVSVPLDLGHPTWERDPRFNLRNHVLRHALRAPGDDLQLAKLASRLFAEPLSRERPLWELHLIEGHRGDRSAIFAKVHHCMIDGVSGVELLGAMFDATPRPQAPAEPPAPGKCPPLPSPAEQVARVLREGIVAGAAGARALAGALRRPAAAATALARTGSDVAALARMSLASPPRTPFNGHVSVLRRIGWTTMSLNLVKAVKNRLGGTVNDVVLATIASALRGYLEAHGINPDRMELRAMVPVNVRGAGERLTLGNRVSAMIAPLPVGIFDPRERHRQVRAAMAQLKESGQSAQMSHVLDLLEMLPAPFQKPLEWLQMQAAPINTICTNVPGPPVSLYVLGRRLETLVPIVPLAQGVGLAFAILSYADALTIGITVDPALVPDVERFDGLLQAGLEELRALAGIEAGSARATPVPPERRRRPTQVA
jgi:diacylglycerol O-acyltransferase / wax synthase